MFSGLQVIDEFVHAWEAMAWNSTRAAVEMAEVTRGLVVSILDVAQKVIVVRQGLRTAFSWADNTASPFSVR